MYRSTLTMIAIVFLASACSKEPVDDVYDPAHDYFSYANTEQFLTRHLELDLTVDFDQEQLRGSAVLHMRRLDPQATEVILDSRGLDVDSVSIASADGPMVPVSFRIGDLDPVLGSPLTVILPTDFESTAEFKVQLGYSTGRNASALQWLPPELTAGGKQPFMFTQSQSIHARSWVPIQDTPAVRITYEAVIHTPSNLLAVMSANNDPLTPRSGEYRFEMPQPIPSYLLALAVGNIFFAPLGAQTGVYTEPEVLDAAAFEFSNTQDMLDTAAEMFGPYQWGRYDLLVLPPSFPYGGMENPRLSFITPSLLAGDHSLVSVIAHELAHSWSGNLVTNATWRDGWLNEGMTNYLEARLMEVLYGQERVDEENVLGYKELLLNFDRIIPKRQALAPPFASGDPDDFQGTIHYHKGQLLLQYLENGFGRETFDRFLTSYFDDFAFQSITTERFLDYLDQNLLQAQKGIISREQVEQWLYQPGLPDDAPIPHSESLDRAAALAIAWAQGEVQLDEIPLGDWSPQAVVHFINNLPASLSDEQLGTLDSAYGFSDTRNAEIGRTWFIQVAQRQYRPAYEKLQQHLNRYGRTRLVAPVYRALAENGADLTLARDMFSDARAGYHPITIAKIETILVPGGE
jgi:leukotriene-A4 hydrolase